MRQKPFPDQRNHKDFNPRTRVGCDCRTGGTMNASLISIHAPAWGATGVGISSVFFARDFNPRTRVGCDEGFQKLWDWLKDFNPRTRVGCDPNRIKIIWMLPTFQSTHPRGVRQLYCFQLALLCGNFNPRTRVGCDCEEGWRI